MKRKVKNVTKYDFTPSKGMSSFEVSKAIIRCNPEIANIQLVSHIVEVNWRQKYANVENKLKKLIDSFSHSGITNKYNIDRDIYLNLNLDQFIKKFSKHEVLSFSSKVQLRDNTFKHVAMMNFHPEDGVDFTHLKYSVNHICGNRKGAILASGRYYHYWGNFLLSDIEWIKFLGEFLMPTVITSPRYIGHQLFNGECTLRLTSDTIYKPQVPIVIENITGKGEGSLFK